MTVKDILYLLGGWSVILPAIVVFIANRWTDKFKADIRARNEENLAELKAELKAQSDKELEELKAELKSKSEIDLEHLKFDFSKSLNGLSSTIATASANFSFANEKRLEAIEVLWKATLELREFQSTTSFLYSVLTKKELEELMSRNENHGNFFSTMKSLNEEALSNNIAINRKSIEPLRPFLTVSIWSYYLLYSIFIGRTYFLLFKSWKNEKLSYWMDDKALLNVFEEFLSKEERQYIFPERENSYNNVLNYIESKITEEINKFMSGKLAAETTFDTFKRLNEILKLQKP